MEFLNLKQPHGANKYPGYTAIYSKYTAVYSRVYGRILRYGSLEYTAVYPKSPKWGNFKHNIDHHNWQTRGIPQPTYACIVHYTFVRLSYMQTLSKTFSAWSTVQAVQKQCNKAPVEENSEQHKQLYDAEVFFGICFH